MTPLHRAPVHVVWLGFHRAVSVAPDSHFTYPGPDECPLQAAGQKQEPNVANLLDCRIHVLFLQQIIRPPPPVPPSYLGMNGYPGTAEEEEGNSGGRRAGEPNLPTRRRRKYLGMNGYPRDRRGGGREQWRSEGGRAQSPDPAEPEILSRRACPKVAGWRKPPVPADPAEPEILSRRDCPKVAGWRKPPVPADPAEPEILSRRDCPKVAGWRKPPVPAPLRPSPGGAAEIIVANVFLIRGIGSDRHRPRAKADDGRGCGTRLTGIRGAQSCSEPCGGI
jgi:hypothetical protein